MIPPQAGGLLQRLMGRMDGDQYRCREASPPLGRGSGSFEHPNHLPRHCGILGQVAQLESGAASAYDLRLRWSIAAHVRTTGNGEE